MISLKINGRSFLVNKNISILEACKYVGIHLPRFCYHEQLSVAGNCRMCLVETDKAPKPIAACAAPVVEGMEITTNSPFVMKARENVLETLLLNHPLDCPICDQAGECDLQDQYRNYGIRESRAYVNKRSVEDKNISPLIRTIMTRCIHCTRCVRFADEVCGQQVLGTLNRGVRTEIGNYIEKFLDHPLSLNVVDLCPVGAFSSQSHKYNNMLSQEFMQTNEKVESKCNCHEHKHRVESKHNSSPVFHKLMYNAEFFQQQSQQPSSSPSI